MNKVLLSAVAARAGGGITYIRMIVPHFPSGGSNRLSILSASPIVGITDRPDIEWIQAPSWTKIAILRFVIGFFYFRFIWPRRNDFDVVYYTAGSIDIPLAPKVKRAVAFRNMLPFDNRVRGLYKSWRIRWRNWILRWLQGNAFRRADLLIFISDYGRDVIDAQVPDRKSPGIVIPHGVKRVHVPLSTEIAQRLPARFVLYLSMIDVYKAQIEVVEAWVLAMAGRPSDLKLVFAGPEYAPYAAELRDSIRQHGLEDQVVLLGEVPPEQVFDLAERAELNLFMSSCENCPNIVLELFSVGRPVLLSSWAPMPELGGPDLAYADPYEVQALAAAMTSILEDPIFAKELGGRAAERAKLFTWEKAARATWPAILALSANSK